MSTFEIVASMASIISLLFAFFVSYRQRIAKAKEKANILILKERLRNIDVSLRSAMTNLQIIIRRADSSNVPIEELQNLSRTVRTIIYATLIETKGITTGLKEWKFGELLETGNLKHEIVDKEDLRNNSM